MSTDTQQVLLDRIKVLSDGLNQLLKAAFARETTMGDPCRSLTAKAELHAAHEHALDVLAAIPSINLVDKCDELKFENTKGFNQGVVYSAAIISNDSATFAAELLASAGLTKEKALYEFECDEADVAQIDENDAWPRKV